MILFADLDHLVIGKMYEQMNNMLGHIKDNIEIKDVIMYDYICREIWDSLNVLLHPLAYVLAPKYCFASWLAQLEFGG
jgi:hypothetical protein